MSKFQKVLLVEDDPITVLVCERIIKLTDFAEEVVSVNNGQEALDFFADGSNNTQQDIPEIIFLDINMPIMNGWEFLDEFSQVKSSLNKTPLIYILSSTVDPEDEKKGLSYTYVKNFLSKPLTKEHLDEIEPVKN
jgi:CheY-like chemotaxis protein